MYRIVIDKYIGKYDLCQDSPQTTTELRHVTCYK